MKINIIAHPNSKKPRIEKDLHQTLHVYVREPAIEGQANRAVAEALAEHYKTSKSHVRLVSGERSKGKVFEILV